MSIPPSPEPMPAPDAPDAAGGSGGRRRLAACAGVLGWAAPRFSFVEEEILGLQAVVRPGDVCFDVGAEFGLYTYPLARLVGPRGAVHSFEPLPGPMRALAAGVRLLGCTNVRRYRMALGREPGRGELSLPHRRGLPVHGRAYLTSGARDQGPNIEFASSSVVRVEVSTVDDIRARHGIGRVDFIKADVEGAEPAVLDGAVQTLADYRPALLLEIEERHLAKYGSGAAELTDRLAGLGYRMHAWRPDTGRAAAPRGNRRGGSWQRVEEVSAARRNYLFTAESPTGSG
jgi:FkbM family methyltransferase